MANKYPKIKLLFFGCLSMVLLTACKEDIIDLGEEYYLTGGRGTSETTGAFELKLQGGRKNAQIEYIDISFSAVDGIQRIGEFGGRTIYYDNITPGTYSFSIDIVEWKESFGTATDFSIGFGPGGFSSSSGASVFSRPKYEHVGYNGTARIVPGEILVIVIDI